MSTNKTDPTEGDSKLSIEEQVRKEFERAAEKGQTPDGIATELPDYIVPSPT